MSDRLDKAKAALEDAKKQHNDDHQKHLLAIARTQAAIAGAEALEKLVSSWPYLRVHEPYDVSP